MVLEYFGTKKSETELGKLSAAHRYNGTTARNLVLAGKKLGYKGFYKDFSSLKDIKKYLDKKIPVIVDWFSHDDGHYSVVVGMDEKFIYLRDPELKKINKIDLVRFERVWFDFKGNVLKKKHDMFVRRMIVIYP